MGKIDSILEQVRKTKEIMLKNMDALLVRGQKLEDLKDKTADLASQAKLFAEEAHALQERAKSRYLAVTFILIGVSVGALYMLVQGYAAPWVLCGCIVGGAIGYAVNFVRNWFVETFFPSAAILKPTASVSANHKVGPDSDLETKLGQSNNLLHNFGAQRVTTSVASTLVSETLKSSLKL